MSNPHRYLPHTEEDIKLMLDKCGAKTLDDLYADVPASLRLSKPYALPKAMSEPELYRFFGDIASDNREMAIFAGAGFYHHYTPAAIPAILSRSEFLTAYTPYQPEISQGTLQYIFEYQSMMCELTGMDVSNASMYDGATATAEAMIMAVNAARRKNRILMSATVAPEIQQVAATYAAGAGIKLDIIPENNGTTSKQAFEEMMSNGDVAGVIVSSPNYYGIIEDYSGYADVCHNNKALFIMNCHAATLATLKSPDEWGADIACGEAQSLGMPLNYGGPYLGYLCCKQQLMRKLPGRIVGATVDAEGRRSFVLTLQAREQHIRRQKATSNICSNQGMMTLHAAMYLSLMGTEGMKKVNRLSFEAAHALAAQLTATGKCNLKYADKPFLNEFVVEFIASTNTDNVLKALANENILGGVKLSDSTMLIAATEMCSPDDIARYVSIVKSL
ncbi:MAG: aminomethyl-transferring glycine dehydrogenase subunit GcvPA [Muribaculaceae bacterium]|nr:aminomethyl-transferring glycine dehydrogenase subunit GcvPA [Muribaculaceae bacterium]